MKRIVVGDDHVPTRNAVSSCLRHHGFVVAGQAGTGPAAVALVRQLRPDVALLDVQMPGDGIVAARAITSEFPQTAVVMLTVSQDDDHLFGALRAGAVGFLHKGMQLDRIPHALEAVLTGEAALPRSLVLKVVKEFREREGRFGRRRKGLEKLTDREWEILDLLRQGYTTRDIASRFVVAPVTVRTHVSAMLRKLQVSDRAAAIRLLDDETGR